MATKFIDIDARGFAREIRRNRRKLARLKQGARNRVIRGAVSQALKPVTKDLKQSVPVLTKTLKKSIGRKVKTYRAKGTTVGITGPRGGMARVIGRQKHDPIKYAHFIERKHGTWSDVHRRHRRKAIREMGRHIRAGIERELRKR